VFLVLIFTQVLVNMGKKLPLLAGSIPLSFNQLMKLKETDEDAFESLTASWPPAPHKRAFGGHVYAQAVYAASKTVAKGLVVHQVNGYFLLPGAIDVPYVYRVRRIRDGGMYALRSVDVFQDSDAAAQGTTPCFVGTMSFKRSETGKKQWKKYRYQNIKSDHIGTEYQDVLTGLRPEDHPLAPGADALWWEREEQQYWSQYAASFPGVECRKVDMAEYNGKVPLDGGQATVKYRQLQFYRIILDEAEDGAADLNLHAAAHLYASDRNSLFLIQRALGYEDVRTNMASLSHTVSFQGSAEDLRMVDETGKSKWFVQEAWTSNGGDNRGTHKSLLWDHDTGTVIGETLQDGMLRFPADLVEDVRRVRRATSIEKIESKL
jgi:acyl-CoA thioesterase II